MAALSIFILIIKRIYCHRVYEECHLHVKQYYDKPLLKEIGGFAGWSLLGSSSGMIANYGQTILLNIYFGTFVNAAQAISGQISGQLGVFSLTLTKALNPVIDKFEGSGDRVNMVEATLTGTKVSYFLLSILYVPFLIEMPFILKIWLKNVPEFAVLFCRLLLIKNLIEQFYIPISNAIAAVGNIKSYQKINSLLNVAPIILAWILFYIVDFPAYSLYVIYIIFSLAQFLNILRHSKINFDLSYLLFFKEIVLKCLTLFILSLFIGLTPIFFIGESLIRLCLVFGISISGYLAFIWILGLSEKEKISVVMLKNLILKKIQISKNVSV